MASPAIALRFRDTTPGVDTIEAHTAILQQEGLVWWGWWKKSFEEDHLKDLEKLVTGEPIQILIVDRSTERMFCASTIQWSDRQLDQRNLAIVPEYYRENADSVFGWFLLTAIEKTEYVPEISKDFGDNTLLILGKKAEVSKGKLANTTSTNNRSCILHLSDLHFGPDYDFITQQEPRKIADPRKTLTDCILADLDRLKIIDEIAAIVVTGDFTTAGNWNDDIRGQILIEFEVLRNKLGLKQEQIVAVPGNHDIVRYPKGADIDIVKILVENQTGYKHERDFRTFVDELIGRNWKDSLNYVRRIHLKNSDLLICVLNSCTILATEWTEYGYVGNSGLDAINQLKLQSIERPTYKFMALHHHLLPVADVEAPNSKGVTLSLDATQLLDAAQSAGVHVAIHGHQHMPRLAKYQTIPLMGGNGTTQPIHVVSNGSTGVSSSRRPGSERNTYCVFRLDEDKPYLWMRELRPDGKGGASLYEGVLDVSASCPV